MLGLADQETYARVDAIKEEWRLLWLSRTDDKVRAEGIANQSFSLLSVERGTVIVATRAFRPLDLREILRFQNVRDIDRFLGSYRPDGGWAKFARTVLNHQPRTRKWNETRQHRNHLKNLQVRQSGRGWLHHY